MTKPYHELTSAERLTARIAKNREIDEKIQAAPVAADKPKRRKTAADERTAQKNNTLDKFHEIRKSHGIDAASEYLRNLRNQDSA
jgi:hypothetical protein